MYSTRDPRNFLFSQEIFLSETLLPVELLKGLDIPVKCFDQKPNKSELAGLLMLNQGWWIRLNFNGSGT